MSAGDALCVQDVLIGGHGAASQLQNPPIATLSEQIKLQFCQVRIQRVNDLILGTRGIDFESFYQGGMINRFPGDLAMLIDSQVQKFALGTTILVAGVDDSGSHIYSIDDPGTMACFDRLGYHAIGMGHRHGVLELVSSGQHPSKSVEETIANVYRAKRVAELAPGVGQATSMKIVERDGTVNVEQVVFEILDSRLDIQFEPNSGAIKRAKKKFSSSRKGDGHDETVEQSHPQSGGAKYS